MTSSDLAASFGGPDAFQPDAFDSEAYDPEAYDPEAYDPEAYDAEAYDDVFGSGTADPGAIESDATESDAVEPGVAAPEVGRPSHLRVAPKVSRDVLRRRRRARYAVFGVAVISAASMFTLVAFHVFAVQSAFQLDKLDTQLSTEQRQYELLRGRVAALTSPETVAHAAAQLGMVRAPNVTLLHAPAAASFGPAANLPKPPPTPYRSIAAGP